MIPGSATRFIGKVLKGILRPASSFGEKEQQQIEELLLTFDVGIPATQRIMEQLKALPFKDVSSTTILQQLRSILIDILKPIEQPLSGGTPDDPLLILAVGVNGVGKTTTIAKLAHYYQQQQPSVLLVAADTFRAAAVEQLQVWGKRLQLTVIAEATGAKPGAVLYSALQSAVSQGAAVILVDTAGRLHTHQHLMSELAKLPGLVNKFPSIKRCEIMLVLDAETGQNTVAQAKQFLAHLAVSGITLTKMDGTARGGSVFALASACHVPVRFIAYGEQVTHLRPFSAVTFVDDFLKGADDPDRSGS